MIVLGLFAGSAAAQPGQTPVSPPYSQPAPMPPQPMPPAPQPPEPMPPQPEAQPMPPTPPPRTAATRATFVSTGDMRWDVRIDNNAVCTTPCSLLIDPMHFLSLHGQERTRDRLAVGYLPPGDVMVQAKPRAEGAFAAGVTFTALSGMGLATGITLTAVGYGVDNNGMFKAGLITGGVSAVGLYLSIDLIRRSLPRVYVTPMPATPYTNGQTVGLAGRF